MTFKTILLAAFVLGACAARDDGDTADISRFPETKALGTGIAPIGAPMLAQLGSMQVWNVIADQEETLDIRSYGNGIRTRESNGCMWTRGIDWFAPSDSFSNCSSSANWKTASARVTQTRSLFPLQVGSQAEYDRRAVSSTGKTSERTTSCKATDAVQVSLPSGQAVPAYLVRCDDGRIRRMTWYAHGLGPVAYREEHHKKGLRDAWVRISI